MTDKPFVHLHLHTQYSLLDGACRLSDLAKEAAADGMEALAITDHGNLFGAVKFFKEAAKHGLRPIVGCEGYVASGSRFDQDAVGSDGKRPYSHLILLCENDKGYKNLCSLVTKAYLEGFSYKPRMDKALLREHSEGLIALSACLGGEIPRLLRHGKQEEALRSALEHQEIFGPGNFYLELQDHGIPEQAVVNQGLKEIHRETGIPLVATNDAHFMNREDFDAHNILLCIQTKTTREERASKGKMAYTREHYFKRRAEMWDLFSDTPDALLNTAAIAKRCVFSFDTHSRHYPKFTPPEGETLRGYFEHVVRQGYASRIAQGLLTRKGSHPKEAYDARLDREIGLIHKMDLAGYFLVVWDFIRYAKEKGVPVGPGRGSAAGSFVSYCMGITDLDPLRYGLLFERFLNPERITMPDIDIDFCMRGRQEVIQYVTDTYGRENVAQIITFGEMKARLAVRDTGRALGMPLAKVDKVAKLIPNDPGKPVTLESALTLSPQLKEMYDKEPDVKEVIDVARRLEGLTRHASTHAAGVVIAPLPITEFLPLYRQAGGKEDVTTQFSMGELESLGLLKMDFLGLRTLTILHDALALIRKSGSEAPDLSQIPLDDPLTLKLFGDGETDGIFQFESGGMKDILRRLRPKRFEDLIVLNALYRPGPLDAGMIPEYIARAHGKKEGTVALPEAAPVLAETLGVIVYQEQVMLIAHDVAGFTLGQADTLRKVMAKKETEKMPAQRKAFLEGCQKKGADTKKAEELFDNIETFARYGFNKSHSAAYALVAFQTAFLKAHFPAAFMAATLSNWADNTDEILKYMNSCRDMGIELLPPSVNRSEVGFTLEGGAIRYGLSAIKNVGMASVEAILQARAKVGCFRDLYHFCEEVSRQHLNRRVLENLVQAGALDDFGTHRWDLFASLDQAMGYAAGVQEDRNRGQGALFGETEALEPPPLLKGDYWPDHERFSREKTSLGFYLSGHPLLAKRHLLQRYITHNLSEIAALGETCDVTIGGIITNFRQKKSKKGDLYAAIHLEDIETHVDILLTGKNFQDNIARVVKDETVLVQAKARPDEEGKITLLASKVVLLDNAAEELEQRIAGMLLKVPATLCDEEWLSELEELIRKNSGHVPVYMDVIREGESVTRLSLGQAFRVQTGKTFIPELETFLGKDRVRFLFRAARNGAPGEKRA